MRAPTPMHDGPPCFKITVSIDRTLNQSKPTISPANTGNRLRRVCLSSKRRTTSTRDDQRTSTVRIMIRIEITTTRRMKRSRRFKRGDQGFVCDDGAEERIAPASLSSLERRAH